MFPFSEERGNAYSVGPVRRSSHQLLEKSCVKPKLRYNRQSVGEFVFMSGHNLGPKDRFVLLSESCGFVNVRRPPWRVDNCCWASPAQSSSGPSRHKIHDHVLLPHLRLPKPGGPGRRFISPRNRVAPLYPEAVGYITSVNQQLKNSVAWVRERREVGSVIYRSESAVFSSVSVHT
jgi:hypothetical protein